MIGNSDFHSVAFFRKVRDEHAALLSNKTPEEIIAFFSGRSALDGTISSSHYSTEETESSRDSQQVFRRPALVGRRDNRGEELHRM